MTIQGCYSIVHDLHEIGDHHAHEDTRKVSRMKHWRDYVRRYNPTAKDFSISMREVFAVAHRQVPSIVVQQGLVGGNPCVDGTRIPVYMILDAIEFHGTLRGVLKSYPQLSADQVKDAVRFSKIVVECCVEH